MGSSTRGNFCHRLLTAKWGESSHSYLLSALWFSWMCSNKFTQFSSINKLLAPLNACKLGGPGMVVMVGPQGKTNPPPFLSHSFQLSPLTTGEMPAKLQAVTPPRTSLHGAPRWGRDRLFGAGGGWQMAESCRVSRASLSQPCPSPAGRRSRHGHGWRAEQQLMLLLRGPAGHVV